MKGQRKNIALLVESSRVYGRGLLLGIAQFAQVNDSWITTQHPERLLEDGLPAWFRDFKFDGVIVRTDSELALREIIDSKIPVIDLRAAYNSSAFVIETDDRLVVQIAANHLLDRGHRHFGFCGYEGSIYSERRLKFFQEYLAEKNYELSVFETPRTGTKNRSTSKIESAGVMVEPEMVKWLCELPKPVGIMACNDIRGNQVLHACLENELVVPEEIAVIGVDNDEVICNLANPPLSSVENNTRLIGFRAAEMLDEIIDGKNETSGLLLVPPTRIVDRLSSDSTMVADKEIAKALIFIRENACTGIDVSDVVAALPLSRATIERRFRKAMDRSINDEIKRVRIARIKQLLSDTDMKLSAVARIVGFEHPEYLSSMFKKEIGLTPGQYRQDHQSKN